MDNKKERLKKIYNLSLKGVGGEREQAQAILDKLLKKYELSLDDIDDEDTASYDYELKYHGEEQLRILHQTIYKVLNSTDEIYDIRYTSSGRLCCNRMVVHCTAIQKVEIEFLFDFYKRIWEKDKEMLMKAFIQKHEIFGSLKEGEKPTELPNAEMLKISNLMKGISDETPIKQIETKNEVSYD